MSPMNARRISAIALLMLAPLALAQTPRTIEIPFTSHDGYPMLGKLTVPDTDARLAN